MAKAYKPLPHASELWELFDYKPLTGELVRKSDPNQAGTRNRDGYIRVMAVGSIFMAHRLVWCWVWGVDPVSRIDHKDNNPSNNRHWNLRKATHAQNMRNRKATRGYSRHGNGWRMCITVDGIRHREFFYTEEEAGAAYAEAAKRLHGEFACVD
jgi:hypothetical protein